MNNKSIIAEAIKSIIKENLSQTNISKYKPGQIYTYKNFQIQIIDTPEEYKSHPYSIGNSSIWVKDLKTQKQHLIPRSLLLPFNLQTEVKEDDAPASNKLSQFSLGMKTARVVISGEDVTKNHEKILKLGQDIDPNFEAKYYEATEKIVGSMSKVKIQPLNLKFRDRSLKAVAEDKPQTKK